MGKFIDNYFWLIILAAIWSLAWKGVALWKAAKRGDKRWFIVLLVVNTLAILEIVYLRWFAKEKKNGEMWQR